MRTMGGRKTEDGNDGCGGRGVVLSSLVVEAVEERRRRVKDGGYCQCKTG